MAKVAETNLVVDITDNDIIQTAMEVKSLHTDLGELETKLSEKKEKLVGQVKSLWLGDVESQTYQKNYKAVTSLGIVQVEAKIASAKGVMDGSFGPTLQAIFGDYKDILFEKETVLAEVIDKRQVLMALLGPGINLNDIEITFKNHSLMKEIEKVGCLTTKEVFVPKSKFLESVNTIPTEILARAEEFLKKFMDNVMSLVVVCGNRGKK